MGTRYACSEETPDSVGLFSDRPRIHGNSPCTLIGSNPACPALTAFRRMILVDYGIMSILCTSDMRPADQEESAASSTVYSLAMAERLDALAYAHPGVVSKPNSAVLKTSYRLPFNTS